jgi:predicted phosphodiesterase
MFDRSLLPDARLEFVVVSDTHYMLDTSGRTVEFESRRSQTARAERALSLIGSLNASFVVHLGDLVQAIPESERFERAVAEARQQLARCGVHPRHVAGNHDVGDKPDPTMPTAWVSSGSLATYHRLFGRSWYSWEEPGVHCVALNAQLLNSALPEADDQRRWVESDLLAHTDRRIFVFLHLPPFLDNEQEPALGHYDNIDEPARGWLLQLLRKHRVELVFAGHSHFAFVDRVGETWYYVAASTSFTRPGFSEAFSSGPPPEQGRDDTPKLGFYLVRVQERDVSVHFIRTCGDVSPVDKETPSRQLITRTSRDLPQSPLGMIMRHPLAPATEVPIAWPSAIRQPVRNDYPWLACTELGVRHLRVPACDLDDALQRRRLALLRQAGVQITAIWPWSEQLDLPGAVARQRDQLDGVELQLLGTPWPDEVSLQQVHKCTAELGLPVTLTPVIPGDHAPGKQIGRNRSGYQLEELTELNRRVSQLEIPIDRVLCRVDSKASAWDLMRQEAELPPFSHIGALDWIAGFSTTDEQVQIIRAAEAIFAISLSQGSCMFLEPLVDLDRTMDVSHGLLDRLCNPRPVFHVVRCMNTILFGSPEVRHPVIGPVLKGARILGLAGPTTTLWLLLPLPPREESLELDLRDLSVSEEGVREVRCFQLESGTSQSLELMGHRVPGQRFSFNEATLLMLTA